MDNLQINAERFMGFADVYDSARPKCPGMVKEIILRYLGRMPSLVVDVGCGTGLSTIIWSDVSKEVVGIEPSADMITRARYKSSNNVKFVSAFSDNTGLENDCADIVTCSQSFHWMDPGKTINEVSRLLKDSGVFAVYDCDWPPVCNWEVEKEYNQLFEKVKKYEAGRPELKNSYKRWPKNKHLSNIETSGVFRYVREIVFSNTEECDSERLINLALSQGGLQSIRKAGIIEFDTYLTKFRECVINILGNKKFDIYFSYRMRIGIK